MKRTEKAKRVSFIENSSRPHEFHRPRDVRAPRYTYYYYDRMDDRRSLTVGYRNIFVSSFTLLLIRTPPSRTGPVRKSGCFSPRVRGWGLNGGGGRRRNDTGDLFRPRANKKIRVGRTRTEFAKDAHINPTDASVTRTRACRG